MSQTFVSYNSLGAPFFVCDTVYETVSHTCFVKTVKSLIGYALKAVLLNRLFFVFDRLTGLPWGFCDDRHVIFVSIVKMGGFLNPSKYLNT